MSSVIRAAQREDVAAILAIYNEAIRNTTASWHEDPLTLEAQLAWFDEKQAKHLPVLVAEADGVVIGWSSLSPFRGPVGYRFTLEDSVYVAHDQRGKGVGKALLTTLIEAARALNCHTLIAGMEASNQGSFHLHAGLGFVSVAHFKEVGFKFGRWLDLIFLQLMLTAG